MSNQFLEDILHGLNPEQRTAVETTDGPVLILAGAGSGKTKCLTHRLAYLVANNKADLSEILGITFTNKASQEFGKRILAILGESVEKFEKNPNFIMRKKLPWIGTFHSISVRLIRMEAVNIGINPSFTIFDSDDSLSLVRKIILEKNLDTKQYNPNAIYSIIENAKNELLSASEYQSYVQGHFQETALAVYKEYEKRLINNDALDFNDLIMTAVKLLKNNPELKKFYHQKFKYVLIDEYQDTNKAQYQLTKLLTDPESNNICVVGDDYQSIYQWRGANYQNILNFHRDYPDTKIFKLEQNYRSTGNILSGAGSIISKVKNRSDKKLWTENEQGVPITVYEARNSYDEAEFISTEIKSLKNFGISWSSFAVLYRTNAQSRVIEESFLKFGIPYRLIGAFRFYDRKEVKDILAYLKFLANPNDLISLSRIINVPPRKIGPKTFSQGGERVENFLLEMSIMRDFSQENTVIQTLEKLIAEINYKSYILDGTEEGESRWENVEELINLATEFDNISDFLEHVALVSDVDSLNNKSDAVTMMTIHSSKGLEFNTVFISGMEEGLLPHSRSFESNSEMDEERRLCYVGMTRAEKRLYLTFARQRITHGLPVPSIPSRFINEIDSSLVDLI